MKLMNFSPKFSRKKFCTIALLYFIVPNQADSKPAVTEPRLSPQDIKLVILSRSNQPEEAYYVGWTTERWDGNNKPYAIMRKSLYSYKKKGLLKEKIARFKAEARAEPLNPQKQFRWVFAEYLMDNKSKNLLLFRQALAIPISPHTYDYARLRFIVTANVSRTMGIYAGSKSLRDVGVRLLKVVPNDERVAYWVRRIRKSTDSLEDKKINLREALSLAHKKPNDAYAQSVLGGAYLDLWMMTEQRSDGMKAVEQYKKYLKLAPKDAAFRENAIFWINTIPKDQANFEAKGKITKRR